MPRYYKEKLYYEDEKKRLANHHEQLIMNRQNKALDEWGLKEYKAHKAAIAAAFRRMYLSAEKTKI